MAAKFDDALRLHQAGTLAEAAQLYQEILIAEPQHADTFHLLGVLMHQTGRSSIAVELIGQAIAINRRFEPYHNNLGNALKAVGEIQAARQSFERSLALSPTASAYINLANLEFGEQNWTAAREDFLAALRCDPKSAGPCMGWAILRWLNISLPKPLAGSVKLFLLSQGLRLDGMRWAMPVPRKTTWTVPSPAIGRRLNLRNRTTKPPSILAICI